MTITKCSSITEWNSRKLLQTEMEVWETMKCRYASVRYRQRPKSYKNKRPYNGKLYFGSETTRPRISFPMFKKSAFPFYFFEEQINDIP